MVVKLCRKPMVNMIKFRYPVIARSFVSSPTTSFKGLTKACMGFPGSTVMTAPRANSQSCNCRNCTEIATTISPEVDLIICSLSNENRLHDQDGIHCFSFPRHLSFKQSPWSHPFLSLGLTYRPSLHL